ncbi:OsmC family protein [Metabacillus malikii]|uniref:OsmC-like protein n=1 Tax=Metabacillus malikii TaxID=1504265 RepID=A0ABT9ZEP7_9BACI|nr:OsmC family protein [Metabacillus malikii]MDQ0230728.1 putative OsmC-like protein [Metabacillus malikii]
MQYTINKAIVSTNLNYGRLHISPNASEGFRPYELFISSLAGCSGAILAKILEKKRIAFEEIDIDSTFERNPIYSNRFEKIEFNASIKTSTIIGEKQAEKIAELVLKNCGMIQSVNTSVDITFVLSFVQATSDYQ